MSTDIYADALRKLRADKRSLMDLWQASGIPASTLRYLRTGKTGNPGIGTLRRLIDFYAAEKRAKK